jgi:hypothetical protein
MTTSNRFDMETVARQHQAEIARELATHHLLEEARLNTLGTKKSRRIVLQYSAAIVLLSLLLHYLLS